MNIFVLTKIVIIVTIGFGQLRDRRICASI